MEKVLITGISGGQGRLLARRLRENYEVCGVDRVGWEGAPRGVNVHTVDVRKKKFEDVIRTEMPTAIVHMGFIRHFRATEQERYDVNVRGTKQLLDHCVNHGVQSLVVLSSSYVYGAAPENPYYMDEDSPLAASRSYPEIRDLVEVDTLASTYLWRYPHLRTCVLRPVNVLGYYVHSMIGQYLREIAAALEAALQGVFNVTGPGEVPLHTAIRETGGTSFSMPELVMRPLFDRLFRWGAIPYPAGAIDYLKYPVTVSGTRFAEATNFRPLFGLEEIFHSMRR
jgi:UDP-glucose 4-epimerase